MSKTEEQTIDVKLYVDEEKSRVLFAECDKDFVDVLFSFLTLPLGTVARVLGKQSQLGCLDEVYKSVEGLSADYFRTKACKAMLLAPLNSAFDHCLRLKVRVDDSNNPRSVYVCKDTNSWSVHGGRNASFSSVPDAICKCGKVMQYVGDMPEIDGKVDPAGGALGPGPGVFVNAGFKFIVTDDLRVAPASTSLMLSLLEEFGVRDPANLDQRIIRFTSEKIASLLKRSLTSKHPLTGLCFDVPPAYDDVELSRNVHPEQGNDAEHTQDSVKIKILQTKNNSSLLYAEVGHDFVDLLFGILCIPLGSIMKAYSKSALKGCIDNLYNSIDCSAKGCIRPECQSLLLSPKVSPFFGCGATKVLQVEELAPNNQKIGACVTCLKIHGLRNLRYCHEGSWKGRRFVYANCQQSEKSANLHGWDPRSPMDGSENREAFVQHGPLTFMVTDNLHVLPLCLASTLQAVVETKLQRTDLVEKEYSLTNYQVMELVQAALVTRKALSSVLLPPKNKKKLHHYNSQLY